MKDEYSQEPDTYDMIIAIANVADSALCSCNRARIVLPRSKCQNDHHRLISWGDSPCGDRDETRRV